MKCWFRVRREINKSIDIPSPGHLRPSPIPRNSRNSAAINSASLRCQACKAKAPWTTVHSALQLYNHVPPVSRNRLKLNLTRIWAPIDLFLLRRALSAFFVAFVSVGCTPHALSGDSEKTAVESESVRQGSSPQNDNDNSSLSSAELAGDTAEVSVSNRKIKKEIFERKFKGALLPHISRSSRPLRTTKLPTGQTRIQLPGGYGHATLAKRNPDGTVSSVCVDNMAAAERWLISDADGEEEQ